MAKEKVLIQVNNEIIELKGEELEKFNAERAIMQKEAEDFDNKLAAQKALKISAYKKLGLTDEEINAIF